MNTKSEFCPYCGQRIADTIGGRLMIVRKNTGLSQTEFAEKFGVGLSTYSAYENNHQLPKSDLIVRICKKYDVSADWLLGIRQEVEDEHC